PPLLPRSSAPVLLLWFHPSLDTRLLPHERRRPAHAPAVDKQSKVLSLDFSLSAIFGPTYLPRSLRSHPRASPGLAGMAAGLRLRARILLVLPEIDSLAAQSEEWTEKMRRQGKERQLEIVRAEGIKHGWTRFPETWIGAEEIRERRRVFSRALEFVMGGRQAQ
ncbi:hypothetical protein BJ546DRAFT_866372, partial [Cryomyces antarcticus]